jgi:hypothetical protein
MIFAALQYASICLYDIANFDQTFQVKFGLQI